ncbi:hypothetical protein QR680_014983 [Steinernema hermaphroditum]|uniref:CHK kinase-like domain-containing protein n=1 Tax=Steinernema hermaphroditum TaxID=289476 RepID=A0AA39M4S7_9BILA|nr:hypothetical protein QR680_014983 [Steinernema hermaphroditum]
MSSPCVLSPIEADLIASDGLNPENRLSDTPFSVRWLLDALSSDEKFAGLRTEAKIENIETTYISKGNALASKVYKVAIKFVSIEDCYEVILKVPGVEAFNEMAGEGEGPVTLEFITNAHNVECDFYNNYAPHLDIPVVKVFKAVKMAPEKNRGALLMESLIDKAEMLYITTGCNREQTFNLAKHLASFYKHFLCLPKEQWVGKYTDNVICSFANEDIHAVHVENFPKMRPGVFDRAYEIFKDYAFDHDFYRYTMTDVYKDVGLPLVLSHGDLHSGNMMWKLNSDGSVSNELAAIIDWQMIHEGCITNDIARFMCVCLDGEVRRECEYKVLQFMYDRIVELMKADGKKVDFTYEQMKKGYQANIVGEAPVIMIMVPLLFGNEEKWSAEEKPVKCAERDRMLLRGQYTLDDAIEYLKEIPNPKYRLT